ncbi:MAG: alginate export family protein [Desulfobacteraceae bacterium]|nr:alginate export family protein [Desulfobacteraceae bacterium]
MKKTLAAAAISSALVLGLAGVSLADDTTTPAVAAGGTKITIDGSVRERGRYDKSTNATKDASGASYYDSRVLLGVNAQVSPEASGYIQLETGSGNNDSVTWGQPTDNNGSLIGATSSGNSLMDGGNKGATNMDVRQAWINYKPGDFGVKVGHQLLALGNKMFFDHASDASAGDDAITAYGSLNGGATNLAAIAIKFDEGKYVAKNPALSNSSDDINGYVGLVTQKVNDNLNLGANWTYLHSTQGNKTDATYNAAVPGLSMSNVGLTADGKVGAISYLADGEFQFGTFKDDGITPASDAKGWAAKVGGNYDLGGGKVGLLFGYGSGTKHDEKDGNQHEFIDFLSPTAYDTIIAGYRAAIPGAGWGNSDGKNSGLSNLTLYQLNGSTKTVCPLTGKDLTLFASLSYMQLSEDIVDPYNNQTANKVGTEADLVATWALTPGLSYKVEAAYLWAGDAFDTIANNGSPDNLMFLRHSLELKF